MTLAKGLLVVALVLGAHFAMTFNVPARAGKGWFGWPFAAGDPGLLGGVAVRSGDRAPAGSLLAALAAGGFVAAILSFLGLWLPESWWPPLAAAAAISSLLLMGFNFSPNKLLAIAVDLAVMAIAAASWTAVTAG